LLVVQDIKIGVGYFVVVCPMMILMGNLIVLGMLGFGGELLGRGSRWVIFGVAARLGLGNGK